MTVYNRHAVREFWITDVVGAAQTIVADGAGDVTAQLYAHYVVQEEAGAGTSSGSASVAPGATTNIYNDGVDIVQLQVAANGAVTVQRTAGADTFNIKLDMIWI